MNRLRRSIYIRKAAGLESYIERNTGIFKKCSLFILSAVLLCYRSLSLYQFLIADSSFKKLNRTNLPHFTRLAFNLKFCFSGSEEKFLSF